ncbi:MAG: DEAD/DEAH box helicase family protein, partial [Candidatus Melainabacteria bacterium]|nr:DEAD/DEAH box helicase family protein [Candidatus Melainabacteria bacterium]
MYIELRRLAELKVPLINLNGVWVELNPEKLQSILQFFKKQSTKKASQGELVRMALGDVRLPDGVTFDGITGEGPVTKLVEQLQGQRSFEEIPVEDSFAGTLRAYQSRGMSWLHFLKSVGFGACLADDMGLGKTVQALAFIQSIWHKTADADRLPNLLICPTSVLSNWQNEAQKFTPELNVILHHGLDRLHGAAFRRAARGASLVVTTYSLMLRDQEDLRSIKWESIILDEAQNIKNPQSLQTKTACSLKSNFRVALSGTPVENNVGDLWSLMNFLNPGYLGRYSEFKDRFYVPIQVFQDQEKTEQLKRLTAPFVLRRLKTDKSIIPDLPEKHERKTSCYLTKEQATLYAAVVESATNSIDEATGMKRKSLVLTTLLRLKQICDHPALFITDKSRLAERSGKLKRLAEMSRNIIDGGESILIFTQFKQMGGIIQQHLQNTLGKEVLFL